MSDRRTQRSQARIGQVLCGKWKVEALLGVGGMAAVYSAVHRNGMRVALKMLHPELADDLDTKARFLREGYLANKVEHRGCVSILDDATAEDGGVFLVMELLSGETLQRRAERAGNRLPPAEVASLGDQLLDLLGAAHDKGIIHRDIKPENLFVTSEGVLKVFDFGLARLREKSVNPTISGSVMGTPAFMSPEQAMGKSSKLDGRTDIWSVGATMFTLLTGRMIHAAPTVTELLLLLVTQPVAPIATVMPSLPPALGKVIDRALAFNVEERWPDARSMQTALRAAVGAQPASQPESAQAAAQMQTWNGGLAAPRSQPMQPRAAPSRPELAWSGSPSTRPGLGASSSAPPHPASGRMPSPSRPDLGFAPTTHTVPMPRADILQAVAFAETVMAGAPPKPAAQRSLVLPLVVGVMVIVVGITAILLFGGIVGPSGVGDHGAPQPPSPATSR